MYGGYSGIGSMGNNYSGFNSFSSTRSLQGAPGFPQSSQDLRNQGNQDPSRKNLLEEWFKMMGGLKSVLELGFAAIAIANFYTHLSAMGKKIVGAIKRVISAIFNFLQKRVSGTVFSKLANPTTRMGAFKKMMIVSVRVLSVLLLCLAAKLKNEIRKDSHE